MIDFAKFDSMVDVSGLKADIANASAKSGDFEDVPYGEYEVKLEKMELTESKTTHEPMVTMWFKVVDGDQQGRLIFMNQKVVRGFQIHLVNELLRDMEIETPIDFDSYVQYGEMLAEAFDEVKDTKTFHLNYAENKKGYRVFEIKEVFRV